jgi:hypothetical protein
MESMSHWYGVCERTGMGLLEEPLNALSNFAFIYVAFAIYRFYRSHEDIQQHRIWDVQIMTLMILLIGINSILFHVYPTPVTELMDTIPIVIFILLYFVSVIFRIGKCNVFQGIIASIAFLGFSHMLVAQFPRALNDSIGYLSSMIALIVIAVYLHLRARPSSQYFMLAAIIGVVSLFARAIDREVCDMWPVGTHFIWHLCNATLLYILMKQIIRNVNRDARLKRLAGDSTQV